MKEYVLTFKKSTELDSAKQELFRAKVPDDLFLVAQSRIKNQLTFISFASESIDLKLKLSYIFTSFTISSVFEHELTLDQKWPFILDVSVLKELIRKIITSFKKVISEENYWNLSTSKQNEVIKKILNTVASLNNLGIKHGYLSFLSNLKYFVSQLNAMFPGNEGEKIKSVIFGISSDEEKIFKNKPQIDKSFYKCLIQLNDFLLQNSEKINFNKLPKVDSFFDNSPITLKYSDFHKLFLKNDKLIAKYKRDDFMVYRIVMGMVFSLLPLLGISLTRRNHILNLVVQNVERYYKINWKIQLKESVAIENKAGG
ncbi:MAG: hypothetical protein K0R18_1075 [Bacillales bacterium]|jgi:hypothetical protein|nr:hypothetical protein [Bacillales bacterium]